MFREFCFAGNINDSQPRGEDMAGDKHKDIPEETKPPEKNIAALNEISDPRTNESTSKQIIEQRKAFKDVPSVITTGGAMPFTLDMGNKQEVRSKHAGEEKTAEKTPARQEKIPAEGRTGANDANTAAAIDLAEKASRAGMSAGDVANTVKSRGVEAEKADQIAAAADFQAATRSPLEEKKGSDDPQRDATNAGDAARSSGNHGQR